MFLLLSADVNDHYCCGAGVGAAAPMDAVGTAVGESGAVIRSAMRGKLKLPPASSTTVT